MGQETREQLKNEVRVGLAKLIEEFQRKEAAGGNSVSRYFIVTEYIQVALLSEIYLMRLLGPHYSIYSAEELGHRKDIASAVVIELLE